MVFNSVTISSAVTPTVIETFFSHYLNRRSRHQKPTAHISYHEGLSLIRQFLKYASYHTVEDIQHFTSQWVPNPRWVKIEDVTIPQKVISEAAVALRDQLGRHGVDSVGGEKWWQWRREGTTLRAEWIEMRRDHVKRKREGKPSRRIMLYIHGGAYFFGSVDEHRYQMQRHARKLEARVFARMLVTLRDRSLPLPAGGILLSPWVDLTHSFPSVAGDGSRDYIPAHGFLQRPSAAWPPPNSDDMEMIAQSAIKEIVDDSLPRKSTQKTRKQAEDEAFQGFSVDASPTHLDPKKNTNNPAGTDGAGDRPGDTIPGAGHDLSIMLDGKLITIKDQIHMYTTNQLIAHPLVSPVLQPSLGGLPPLLIMTGGGEVLRDEQIYLAHKAADPSKYPPGEAYLDKYPEARDVLTKWKPTDVQLQVWDDLCHVAPALSFTRPAKYMYRSIAQFGAWVLARAQKRGIEIQEDDGISIISTNSESGSSTFTKQPEKTEPAMETGVLKAGIALKGQVGKAGQPLPPFKSHMVRQRVDRHGNLYDLDPPQSLPALEMPANEIGVIKPAPVQKWLNAKKKWDSRYAREKRKVQRQRAKEMAQGYQGFGDDEVPPPSALAGKRGLTMPKEEKKSRSWLMSLWSLWGSTHDENTIEREEKADKEVDSTATTTGKVGAQSDEAKKRRNESRSKSRRRPVIYDDQDDGVDENTPAAELIQKRTSPIQPTIDPIPLPPPTITTEDAASSEAAVLQPTSPNRPFLGGKAFPFKLGTHLTDDGQNASTVTLMSQGGVVTPKGDEKDMQLGEAPVATEDRRTTIQDSDGVLHKALMEKISDGPLTSKKDGNGTHFHESSAEEVTRRSTMQDSDGVLHKALPKQAIAGSTDSQKEKVNGRPSMERFETAKENL